MSVSEKTLWPSVRRIGLAMLLLYYVPACAYTAMSGGQFSFLLSAPFVAATGILSFPSRAIASAHIDIRGVATFVVALLLLVGVAHLFFRRLWRALDKPQWRLRSTVIFTSLVLAFFVVAMAVAGAVHQVGWLMTTKERLTNNPWAASACGSYGALTEKLAQWHLIPLDGEPVSTSKHYLAKLRNDATLQLRGKKPLRACGGKDGVSGLDGRELDENEFNSHLQALVQKNDP